MAFIAADGTTSAPTYTFASDTTTGIHGGGSQIKFVTSSNYRGAVDAAGRFLINTTTTNPNASCIISGQGRSGRALTLTPGPVDAGVAGIVNLTLAHFGATSNDGVGCGIRAVEDGINTLAGYLAFDSHSNTSRQEIFRITSNDEMLRMASGTGGIQFNGDTAAANALDDYEEGTWTPTYSGWTSAPTAGAGRYIKVGKIVYLTLGIGACTSATGGSTIGGVPYDAGASYDMCGLIVDQASFNPVNPASGAVLGFTLRNSTIFVERTALTLRDRSSLTITYRVA